MQLSNPTSSDPNLLTLLFPAPAGGNVLTADVPALPGAIIDFAALLAPPRAAGLGLPARGEAMLAPATPVSFPLAGMPAVAEPAAEAAVTPAPRPWTFAAPRAPEVFEAPLAAEATPMTDCEASDAEETAPALPGPHAVALKVPEGEVRPARRFDDRDVTISPEAVSLLVPLEITPVAMVIGLPEQQRFAVEAQNDDDETGESMPEVDLGGRRALPTVRGAQSGVPTTDETRVRGSDALRGQSNDFAVEADGGEDAFIPEAPFRFARPMPMAFPAKAAPLGEEAVAVIRPNSAPSTDAAMSHASLPSIPVAALSAPESSAISFAEAKAQAEAAPLVPELAASAFRTVAPARPAAPAARAELRVNFGSSPRAAEFAVKIPKDRGEIAAGEMTPPRNFVTTEAKQLTSQHSELGTAVANSGTAMPSASTMPLPTHATFEPVSLLVESLAGTQGLHADASGSVAPAAADMPAAPEAVSNAHRAVEAVLTAAHRFSTSDRHTVNLQFSVGGTDLNVRVELRADEVRATFHTDSPELRAALSQEWQAANQGDRAGKLAPAVFTGGDASNSSFSGDQASQQQQRQSSARASEDAFAFATSRLSGERDEAASALTNSSVAPRGPQSTALHLHTLA